MDITIYPGKLTGTVHAIPSKSHAHRLLICAAFADRQTALYCPKTSRDIEATVDCLNAIGANILRTETGYRICPISHVPQAAVLNCAESGSTLRFLLPIAGALGIDTTFQLAGRLPERPLSPLWEEMERMGCQLSRPTANTIKCKGKLTSGTYNIRGNVSSQFITGLLFAAALTEGNSQIAIVGKLESAPYVDMTVEALQQFGVIIENYRVTGSYPFITPGQVSIEGDWSNAAFFLAAQALGNAVTVTGLSNNSAQGDRAIVAILNKLTVHSSIDCTDVPDLVPVLAVVAGAMHGAVFTNIARLRLKESDRVNAVSTMLHQLGAHTQVTENTLTVYPAQYTGCTIDAMGDHRIAMAAAVAATAATAPVTILGAQCVAKSYPDFWSIYKNLGGTYEQYIR